MKNQINTGEELDGSIPQIRLGGWYRCNNGAMIALIGEGRRAGEAMGYGFGFDGTWVSPQGGFSLFQFPHQWREAVIGEVIAAFTRELVKRYGPDWENVKIKAHATAPGSNSFVVQEVLNKGELTPYIGVDKIINRNGQLFNRGYWAEIKQEPKIGDICKFWNDDENDFVVGKLGYIEKSDILYQHRFDYWYKNAVCLNEQEVIELLFNTPNQL